GAAGAIVSRVKVRLPTLLLPATSVCRTWTLLLPSLAAKLLFQVPPLSVEYSTIAPVSMPDSEIVPVLVIWSLVLEPVSLVRATPGAATVVSRVKVRLPTLPVLPATSVWRTWTLLFPWTAAKLLIQWEPPSVEYSTVAPASMPESERVPVLVIWSPVLEPVSLVRAMPGAAGASVSRVKLRLPTLLLPATSVCRTWTLLLPSLAAKLLFQVPPLSVEYSTVAPASMPDSEIVPVLVIWSLALEPVSLVRAMPGAAMVVSRVKVRLPTLLMLPATSVWRTCTLLLPSAAVKLLFQVAPPLVEYWTVAPASIPVSDRVPVLVIWSLLLEPVSLKRSTVGAVGAMVSRVKVRLPTLLVLPATSVWRTWTVLLPSAAVKLLFQVEPLSVEYSTAAPASMPLSDRVPFFVTWSVPLVPVSLERETPGAAATVSMETL